MSRSSQEAGGELRRDLKSRHLAMIAIGGSIGTGLFVASGATTLVAALCFFTLFYGESNVYILLLNISGMTGLIAWLGIAVSHYRFRKGFVAQGHDLSRLPYRSLFFPYGPIFAFSLCLIITLGQYYGNFLEGRFVLSEFLLTYIGLILFMSVWLGYRLLHKTRFVPYANMRFPEN